MKYENMEQIVEINDKINKVKEISFRFFETLNTHYDKRRTNEEYTALLGGMTKMRDGIIEGLKQELEEL